jgi:hypothetical protein
MKHFIKQMARRLWRMSAPVRRPVIRKFDHHMMQLLVRPAPTLILPPPAPGDLDMALNSVVRELARLQMMVEILQERIEDLQSSDRVGARSEGRLSVVDAIG